MTRFFGFINKSMLTDGVRSSQSEQFKSTTNFDGPYHLKQHGFT
jgi:hypothetical protein